LCRHGTPDIAAATGPAGSPRVGVVFRLWQCDKDNHGWREGPPLTVLCQSLRSAGRAFTLRLNQFRTKQEYCFVLLAATPLRTLAGLKRPSGRYPEKSTLRHFTSSAFFIQAT
jgi:hypothetical protein